MKEVQDYQHSTRSRDHRYPYRPGFPTMDDIQENTHDLTISSSHISSSKYAELPPRKPFINTDYTRPDRAVSMQPTSDRDAVITALRQLQDKLKRLEVDRTTAEKNLQTLTSETGHVLRDGTLDDRARTHPGKLAGRKGDGVLSQTREVEGQLSSAERRCQLLEQQLLQMRQLVDRSERTQQQLMEKMGKTQQERDIEGTNIRQHIDRLNQLERDQLRLAETQTMAEQTLKDDKIESKIRELEKKIRDEKIHRRTMQERTAQLESAAQTHKVMSSLQAAASPAQTAAPPAQAAAPPAQAAMRTVPAPVIKTKRSTKKRKKVATSKVSADVCRPEPMRHYRLNLAEIPFVAGKSTCPSHSLGANVQKVLAMMKRHNNALCSQMHAHGDCQKSESTSSTGSSTENSQDFSDLLTQLQDEFGQLCCKHQELMDQKQMSRDARVREQLEQELDMLVTAMESKSQQISTIRHYQKKIEETTRVRTSSAKRSDKSRRGHTSTSKHHHHQHYNNNNNRHKPRPHSCDQPIGQSALGKPALFMLRDLKKLQTTLRKDDQC